MNTNLKQQQAVRACLRYTVLRHRGMINPDEGIDVLCNNYNNYAIYALNLTSNLGNHFNLVNHGNVRLALKFSDHSDSNCICRVRDVIKLNRNQNVLVNF